MLVKAKDLVDSNLSFAHLSSCTLVDAFTVTSGYFQDCESRIPIVDFQNGSIPFAAQNGKFYAHKIIFCEWISSVKVQSNSLFLEPLGLAVPLSWILRINSHMSEFVASNSFLHGILGWPFLSHL